MTELSITAKNAAPPPPATPVSAVAPGGFARAFEAFTDAPRPAPTPMAAAAGSRQGDAVDGKKLPADTADPEDHVAAATSKRANGHRHASSVPPDSAAAVAPTTPQPLSSDADDMPADEDDAPADGVATTHDADKVAPIVAFIAVPAAPIVVEPASLPARAPRDAASTGGASLAGTPVSPAVAGALDASLTAAAAPGTPLAAPAALVAATPPVTFELIDAGMPSPAANTPADPTGATAPRIEAHTDAPHFNLALATVVVDPTMTVQPARQAFATALAALSVPAKAPDDDGTDAPQAIPGFAAPTAGTLLQAAVQQVAAANQGALDPRHDRGLHGMIDHIEMLRDDANARDTRIRLAPDALGTVDVALRRDGDALHVRFSSANEATRLVLNDAQPRLAALAEARGVRIAGSSIDSGADRGGNQPQPQPRTESPRPARTPRVAATTDTDTTDQRLA